MTGARWIIRLTGVTGVAVVIAFAVSWSIERGYFYDLLAPALRDDPRYSLVTSLMRERRDRDFDVLTIGSPEFVDQIAASFAPCVRNFQIRLPAYHYSELNKAVRILRPFQYDNLFIENHPAFWSNVQIGQPVAQKRDVWLGFRRRNQPAQIRADLRIAFTLISDAIGPSASVKPPTQQQFESAYSQARYHEELRRWDLNGSIKTLLDQIDHNKVFWFMDFRHGPHVDSNRELRRSLERRFAQNAFDPALGHLYSMNDYDEATQVVSTQGCQS